MLKLDKRGVANLRPITLLQPARLEFGAGSSLKAASFLQLRNVKSVALFGSTSTLKLAAALKSELAGCGISVSEAPIVPAEPSFEDAQSARRWLEATSCEAVIGFGGGSVIDIAKIAAASAKLDGSLDSFVGNGLLPARAITLVAIPTTAGAGSEVSPNAIFLDTGAKSKKGIISPYLVPDAAFIDPELATSLPQQVTASTALDALSHCVEAYANRNAHPLVDVYALKGIELILNHLIVAINDPDDIEARSALALGSLYGGLCLGPVNTAAIHALSYPLGSEFGVPHGLANAMLMPHVLSFNAETAPERYAELARALKLSETNDDSTAAAAFISTVRTLSEKCGLSMKISESGVTQGDIPAMATSALKIQRLLVNNLRELSTSDAESIYQNAF